jgi:hypothetical protein
MLLLLLLLLLFVAGIMAGGWGNGDSRGIAGLLGPTCGGLVMCNAFSPGSYFSAGATTVSLQHPSCSCRVVSLLSSIGNSMVRFLACTCCCGCDSICMMSRTLLQLPTQTPVEAPVDLHTIHNQQIKHNAILLCVVAQVAASTQDVLACYNYTRSVDAHWVVNLSLGGPGTVSEMTIDWYTIKQTICDNGGEAPRRL